MTKKIKLIAPAVILVVITVLLLSSRVPKSSQAEAIALRTNELSYELDLIDVTKEPLSKVIGLREFYEIKTSGVDTSKNAHMVVNSVYIFNTVEDAKNYINLWRSNVKNTTNINNLGEEAYWFLMPEPPGHYFYQLGFRKGGVVVSVMTISKDETIEVANIVESRIKD